MLQVRNVSDHHRNTRQILLPIILLVLCGFVGLKASDAFTRFTCFAFEAPPVCVRSKIIGSPIVNHTIRLHIEVLSVASEPDVVLSISLPEQVELVSGDLTWQGHVPDDNSFTYEIEIQVKEPGEWKIETQASLKDAGPSTTDTIYLLSSNENGQASHEKTPNNWYSSQNRGIVAGGEYTDTVQGTITFSTIPHLNIPVTVSYMITSMIPITDAIISISLPPLSFDVLTMECPKGFEASGGSFRTCRGDLEAGKTSAMTMTIKIQDTGQGSIQGGVTFVEKIGDDIYFSWLGGYRITCLEVNKYGGSLQICK